MPLSELIVPPVLPDLPDQVTDIQLARYAELIYVRTGICVSPQKKALLSNRLRRRLRSTGIEGFDAYYERLKRLPPQDPEWDAFLQEITTHETYLFRDQAQWDWLRNVYLPGHHARMVGAASAQSNGGRACLRIWSAACSTGDEAFTAACCVAACGAGTMYPWSACGSAFANGHHVPPLGTSGLVGVQILGTDIGIGAVEQARTAVFGERAMALVPDIYRKNYFTKAKNGEVWQARPVLTRMVAFRQHNLLEPLREKPFDLVFLKNVLIYFDRDSKKRVMANVQPMIRPGGMLIAGAAEGLTDLVRDLVRIGPWLYQRPGP
jgi:chemotaxis protein methyltransferase CheR